MIENPYSSSASHRVADSAQEGSVEKANKDESLQSIARSVFLSWEKLRPVYVVVLALVTLSLTGTQLFRNSRLLLFCIEGAIFSNLAYFAGPIIETYVRWLGYQRKWPRWFMFAGGTILSILLAVGFLVTQLFPMNLNALGQN